MNENKNFKHIINYLCNWEVHLLLNISEFKSFFELASLVVSKSRINLNDFLTYFFDSPQKLLTSSFEYLSFLSHVQSHLVSKEVDTETKKSPIYLNFVSELIRNKLLNDKFAEIILNNDFLKG